MRLKIKTPNGKITKATLQKVYQSIDLDIQIKELQEKSKGLKLAIKEGIEAENLGSIKTEDFTITYKAPSARNGIDTKRLKEEDPKTYKKYLKVSQVASSIAIK